MNKEQIKEEIIMTVKKCNDNCKVAKAYVEEFAEKLKRKCRNFYPSIDHYCCSEKAVKLADVNELLKEYME